MAEESIKSATIKGTFWKLSERILTQIVSFVISIILARLLMPSDYGIIVLVSVFITICDKIVICGFATSLIQKKDADQLDFSTVFFFSLAMAVILYVLLFISAPFIASFYSEFDRLTLINVIRTLGISLFILAVNSVQHAYVSKTMQFKRYFWSISGGTMLSGIVGVCMAYSGFGVWALVGQHLTMALTDTLILWFTVKWRPILSFSFQNLKVLFSFGSRVFLASLIKTIYNDLRSLVIGKFYSPAELAFYNRGQTFPQLLDSNVVGTLDSVLFPAFSKVQESKASVKLMLRRVIKVSSFVLMPLLAGLASVAEPFVQILLTDKWIECVPFVQILSFSFILSAVEVENLQAIKALGRSDIVLKQEVIKRIIGVIILLISIPLGVKAIAYGMLLSQVVAAIVNAFPSKKLLGYPLLEQLKDILPYLLASLFMFVVLNIYSTFISMGVWGSLFSQVIIGIICYLSIMFFIKDDSFQYILHSLKREK